MTLTIGTGPFGQTPAGVFNGRWVGPAHVLYVEDSPRHVRGVFAGVTVVDSRRTKLMHETGLLPVWYFPRDDVDFDLLDPSKHTTHCPFKGDASYWSVRVGDRVAEDAVWGYPEPLEGTPPIAGHVAVYFAALDAWFEEDEEVFVHPRDPYHRVDALASSRHVRVSLDGHLLAASARPVVLFETGLPPRYYLPREDVTAALEPSEATSRCPYKGTAGYWSVAGAGAGGVDLVWTYPEPLPGVAAIAGRACFYDERVDVDVDGVRQERPRTRWSPR